MSLVSVFKERNVRKIPEEEQSLWELQGMLAMKNSKNMENKNDNKELTEDRASYITQERGDAHVTECTNRKKILTATKDTNWS